MSHLVWSMDPVIVELGPLRLRWYGVLFAVAFVLGYRLMRWIVRKEGKRGDIDSLSTYVVCGTVIGARLVHCFFYEPHRYLAHPIEILKIWEGGLASHGGVAGIAIAVYLYSRTHRDQPFLWLLDRLSIPAALGAGFIRIGNFFNSEIVGKPSDVPWAVVFARIDDAPRHPAMLYEALAYFLVFLGLLWIYGRRGSDLRPGFLLGALLVAVFLARFLLEFVKARQEAFEESMPLDMGQILSVPVIVVGIVLLLRARSRPARA